MKGLYLVTLSLFLLFSACTKITSVAGGGNDFPNPHITASALGKTIANNLSSGDHWGDSIVLPQSPSIETQAVTVPSIPPSAASLAKKHATNSLVSYNFSDTGKGIVWVYYDLTSDSVIKNDTLVLLYDSVFRDTSIKDKHLFEYLGKSVNTLTKIQTNYRYVDADGDSIINNRNGKPNQVVAQIAITKPLGTVEKTVLGLDGGIDANLDTKADNRVIALSSIKISANGDTLSSAYYESYGDAGIIIDPTRTDSCLVRLRTLSVDLLKRRTVTEAIYAVFPLDSVKNYPVYVQSCKYFESGKTVTSIVRSPRPDSLFRGADTALAQIITDAPLDTASADTLQFGVMLGKNPADSTASSLLSIRRHVFKRLGADRESKFTVVSNKPLAHNQALQNGTLSFLLNYTDGKWINAEGTFTPEMITVIFTDSEGNTLRLTWDRNGLPIK